MANLKCETVSNDQAEFIPHADSPGATEDAPSIGDVEFAGFWKRLAATVIDIAVLLVVGFALVIIVPILIAPVAGLPDDVYIIISVVIFWLIVPWLYWSLTESSSKQGTPGKTAMGIIVTDTEGTRISFGRATNRYWAKAVSGVILLSGFVMIAFTARKQGLHDVIAKCLVVNKK
jgi:uncharacterized RDD family membrane protein YckC